MVNLENFTAVMKRYKLDSRVLVQIEENFKVNRENASDDLYIRQVDSKGEMFYLERRLSIGGEDNELNYAADFQINPMIDKHLANKKNPLRNNRESTNTKEATNITLVVQEDFNKQKWFFFGLF